MEMIKLIFIRCKVENMITYCQIDELSFCVLLTFTCFTQILYDLTQGIVK